MGAALVLIVATGFISNRSHVVDWAGSGPSISSDVVGRASVIDGDTFEIQGKRIRVWGIDAPESTQLCHIAGKLWRGQRAALGFQTISGSERWLA